MRALQVALLSIQAVLVSQAYADWPQFLGPNRTGVSPEEGLARSWPEGGPRELWTVKVGAGFGGPSIRDGKVYLLDRTGDKTDALRCIDMSDGKELWRFSYDTPSGDLGGYPGSRGTPAVDDEYVFAVGPFGHFHCISQATHKPVWKKNLLKDFGGRLPGWGVSQSPILYKNMVIVAPQTHKAGVVAYARATGDVLWRSEPMGDMQYTSPLITRIHGVDQVVMLNKGQVRGIDLRNGKTLWTYEGWTCRIPIPSPTHVGDGRIFLTGDYKAGSAMFEVTKSKDGTFTTTELFKKKAIGSHIHNALLHDDHLYLNASRDGKGLVCLGLDGTVKWQTGDSPSFDLGGGLIVADGMIYIVHGQTGELHLVEANPDAYRELGKVKFLDGPNIWAPMALSKGKLVIRDQRQMKCLDVKRIGRWE